MTRSVSRSTGAAGHPAMPGADAWRTRAIAESHERSRAFGLRTHDVPDLSLLSRQALRETHERERRLCEHAMPVMELLFEQVAETRSMVVLTDARGILLHALGDPVFLERAQRVALAPGADWSERAKGTNGIGTALIDETTTLVHGGEHYLSAHRFLTCSAAPMFDHAGGLLGVIDVSADQRSYHPHTLALARLSARTIEQHWFAERLRHALRLHFHPQPDALGTLGEGVIAFDGDGRVLGANRCAVELLGRSVSQLRRGSLSAWFGVSVAQCVDHLRRAPLLPMRIVAAGIDIAPPAAASARTAVWAGGPGEPLADALPRPVPARQRPLFARLSCDLHAWPNLRSIAGVGTGTAAPSPLPRRPAATATPKRPARTLAVVEIDAIEQAVRAAQGNISRAARALGIGRNTIYRKLRRGGEPR